MGIYKLSFIVAIALLSSGNAISKEDTKRAGQSPEELFSHATSLYRSAKTAEDFKEALVWAEKAGKNGVTAAMTLAGSIYLEGNAGKRNFQKAEKWFRRAASTGDTPALFALGRMYFLGAGLEKNRKEAIAYFELAANAEYPPAVGQLGRLYYADSDTNPVLRKRAIQLIEIAAGKGDLESMISLGALKGEKGDHESSCKWYRLAAEKESPIGQLGYGICHSENLIANWDIKTAVDMYTKAADAGVIEAQLNLGVLYDLGDVNLARDLALAKKWYKRAADAGSANAMFNLAKKFLEEGDFVKSQRLLEKAASNNHAPAQYDLAVLYAQGSGVKTNLETAFSLYFSAAENGYVPAFHQVGAMYAAGEGVEKDTIAAVEWLQRASDEGHEGSKSLLKKLNSGEETEIKFHSHAH